MSKQYRCFYNFQGEERYAQFEDFKWLKEGFFVNSEGEFVDYHDDSASFLILPHMIYEVEYVEAPAFKVLTDVEGGPGE